MIAIDNEVSSVWFDNKLKLKSLHFNKCEFTEKFCEFINLIINSVQDSRLKSQNFVEFDCRMFPLGLNTLDNPRENEIHLQLYQSYKKGRIYRCGEFDYIFQFQSWVCDYLCEFSPSLSYWFNWWAQAIYTLRTPRDR